MASTIIQEDIPTSTPTQPSPSIGSMRAVTWHANADVRMKDHPRPTLAQSTDAIIHITSTTICGSDLHLYHGSIPGVKEGDILGHECMGIVDQVGSGVETLKPGDRVVVSAVIADGTCEFCKQGLFSLCNTTNSSRTMKEFFGQKIAGVFGYSHLLGGYPGGQAEYIRVPFADINCLPVPDELPDDKVLFLSDVFSTSWHANELGEVGEGKTVAIWGAGPIGLAAAQWAKYRRAARIIVIDSIDYRLTIAKSLGCEVINFNIEDPKATVLRLIPNGPDVCIDAVGFRYAKSWTHTLERMLKLETDSSDSVSEAIYCAKKGGTVVLIGDYIGYCNHFPIGALMEKGVKLVGSQVHVQKYWKKLLEIIQAGEIDMSFLVSDVRLLEDAPEMYKVFDQKKEGALKIILKTKSP